MDAHLELRDGQRVPVRNGLLIGRVAGCDVVIADAKASRRHARIVFEGGVAEVEDLESSNGTLLNGKPVQRRMLRHGDEIRIGTTLLVFREEAVAPAAVEPAAGPAPGEDLLAEFEDVDIGGDEAPLSPPPSVAATRSEAPPFSEDRELLEAFEELDLDAEVEAVPEPTQPAPPRRPAPKPAAPESARPASATPAPQPPIDEFAGLDEIIQVRPKEDEAPSEPAPVATVDAPKVVRAGGRSAGAQRAGGVLQYSKRQDSGVLGQDVGQTGGLLRLVLVLVALAVMAGAAYGATLLMGSS